MFDVKIATPGTIPLSNNLFVLVFQLYASAISDSLYKCECWTIFYDAGNLISCSEGMIRWEVLINNGRINSHSSKLIAQKLDFGMFEATIHNYASEN